MAKYLNEDGLLYFWQQLKTKLAGKVDTESGKGLSTNDFTNADVSKLEGIATGAQVNKLEAITVNGTAATITNKVAAITTPTKTSDLTNDSGFITSGDIPEGSAASTTTPLMAGTASVGTEMAFARGDHRHPTDTSRAPIASPTFTGTPKAPTATAGTNTTQIATTAFVTGALGGYTTTAVLEQNYAKKTDLTNVYVYKGSVASYSNLPSSGLTAGDVYNVEATGKNYAWTGTVWDDLGGTFTIESISNPEIDTILAS